MGRRYISVNVERRLWTESMGKCMNPDCQADLFTENTDIIEKAHINAYSVSEDNSFENLVILCPNCHKKFDKAHLITSFDIREWKRIRREVIAQIFERKYSSFDEMKRIVKEILLVNKEIYEDYYVRNNKAQWNVFEKKILINNEKLKTIFTQNLYLMQDSKIEEYSNVTVVRKFIQYVNEFKYSRGNAEKERVILFPEELNSIFGITPIRDYMLPMTESLESLLEALHNKGLKASVELGIQQPYLKILQNDVVDYIYLDDVPRIRQMYYDNESFRPTKVRL